MRYNVILYQISVSGLILNRRLFIWSIQLCVGNLWSIYYVWPVYTYCSIWCAHSCGRTYVPNVCGNCVKLCWRDFLIVSKVSQPLRLSAVYGLYSKSTAHFKQHFHTFHVIPSDDLYGGFVLSQYFHTKPFKLHHKWFFDSFCIWLNFLCSNTQSQ